MSSCSPRNIEGEKKAGEEERKEELDGEPSLWEMLVRSELTISELKLN